MLGFLNPKSESFFLRVALVPSEEYFQNFFNDIHNSFEKKIPIVNDIISFLNGIKSLVFNGNTPPKFSIKLPIGWGNKEVNIIDFSFFSSFRSLILNFMRVILWFTFLKRMYNRLPTDLYK